MNCRFPALLCAISLCFTSVLFGQEKIDIFDDRSAFAVAATSLSISDFEGIVPNSGFKHYQREGSLRYGGMDFRTGGGSKFGAGPVMVVGGWYQAGPSYETTSGAKLIWRPPNQPGIAYIEIILPAGVTAAGLDVWAAQPIQSELQVTATTADGKTHTGSIATPARPAAAFIGFVSSSPITSVRITPPRGQSGLIIDNVTLGKRNSSSAAESRTGSSARTPGATRTPERFPEKPVSPSRTSETPGVEGVSSAGNGIVAYVRGSTEIRLINPDGTGDKQLWTHPDLNERLGIFELDWKPDGSELAFSSAHEASSSPYLADIYAVRRDGTGFRRITNPPERAGLGKFRKGSVTVNVSNFQAASETPGTFIVYVVGADEPQQVFIPAGTSKTVTFKSVADFGRQPQMVVAMSGMFRWFVPGVDVIPGRTVTAPAFPITGKGYEMHGAFRPVWRFDGSRVSFRSGLCIVSSEAANPAAGDHSFNPLFGGKNPMGTCTWDWGPTSATANQVIYSENSSGGSNIYQITEGGAHPGTKLTQFSDLEYQLLTDLRWLPDGSGLLYSTVNLYRDSSNIFRYDLATRTRTQVTKLEKEFARMFSVSPDAQTVVFERCPTREDDAGCDLWTVGTNGRGAGLLVKNGQRPSWGK